MSGLWVAAAISRSKPLTLFLSEETSSSFSEKRWFLCTRKHDVISRKTVALIFCFVCFFIPFLPLTFAKLQITFRGLGWRSGEGWAWGGVVVKGGTWGGVVVKGGAWGGVVVKGGAWGGVVVKALRY